MPKKWGERDALGSIEGQGFPLRKSLDQREDAAKSVNRESFGTLRDDPNLIVFF
jgi:hypothetical protein